MSFLIEYTGELVPIGNFGDKVNIYGFPFELVQKEEKGGDSNAVAICKSEEIALLNDKTGEPEDDAAKLKLIEGMIKDGLPLKVIKARPAAKAKPAAPVKNQPPAE